MAEGWIKLHRQLVENDLWSCEPFTRGQAWVDLLLLANHKYSFFYKRNIKIEVKRGQIARSEVELSDRWKWSRSKVRKFINDLEKEQQVKQHKTNITQLLTILNYDSYQEKEQQDKQQEDNKKTAKEQQEDTYKNEKKDKNIKEIVDYLNLKAQRDFKHSTNTTKSLIAARLKEGFTLDNFKTVIDVKVKHWLNTDNEKYLRPETLFGNKFDGYLNSDKSHRSNGLNGVNLLKFKVKHRLGEIRVYECETLDQAKKIYSDNFGVTTDEIFQV